MKRRFFLRSKRLTLTAENIDMAFRAVKSNRLRSALTVTIIALGITSLVGILTAVDSMDATLKEAYSRMGAGIINIRSQYSRSSDMNRIRNSREITRVQAERFTAGYSFPATVSIFCTVLDNTRAEAGAVRTNPTVSVIAADDNYIRYNMLEMASGRSISTADVEGGRFYCVLGNNVARSLFADSEPVGKAVHIAGRSYIIIGVAAEVGNSAGGSMDESILIPYTNALANLTSSTPDFIIGILPDPGTDAAEAASQAEMTFRAVRRLAPYDDIDFRITRSEAVIEELNSTMRTLTVAAIVIGLITLTGAATGLMNIMLVSVGNNRRKRRNHRHRCRHHHWQYHRRSHAGILYHPLALDARSHRPLHGRRHPLGLHPSKTRCRPRSYRVPALRIIRAAFTGMPYSRASSASTSAEVVAQSVTKRTALRCPSRCSQREKVA